MSFGKWLAVRRAEARLTQSQLAIRAGISPNYVSALEREEPNARDGSPRRPRLEKIDRIAKALGVPIDEARLAAGYAPANTGKPQTVQEFIEALDRLGVPGLEFMGHYNGLHEMSPDGFAKLLDDIRLVVDLSLRRMEKQ